MKTTNPKKQKKSGLRIEKKLQIGHILVPVDFSHHSYKALEYAAALARPIGAKITILHVQEIFHYPPGDIRAPVIGTAVGYFANGAAVEKNLNLIKDRYCYGLNASTLTKQGVSWSEIIDAAHHAHVDLIVIATHGYTGFKRILMGSIAEKVVQRASCPVLVVRCHGMDVGLKNGRGTRKYPQ